MNYKESLFFIGKCLTISHEKANKTLVEKELASGLVDWDLVTKVSTAHYVFPALYCNLKRANFLMYLPRDLVEYMIHISDLNRNRNLQIIEQAKEINESVLANNIRPIFLKGTGNLLEGLYQDPAERMVGDIDFLVPNELYLKTIKILFKNKYLSSHNIKTILPGSMHFPRIYRNDKIAAIEIHKELIIDKYVNEFNFSLIEKNKVFKNNSFLLSFDDQFILSIVAYQINDNGQYFKTIALRNSYDIFLLSKKVNTYNCIKKFNYLFQPLNNYIALSNEVFGNISSFTFKSSANTKRIIIFNNRLLKNSSFRKKNQLKWNRYLFLKTRLTILYKSMYLKPYRIWLLNRLIKGRSKLS